MNLMPEFSAFEIIKLCFLFFKIKKNDKIYLVYKFFNITPPPSPTMPLLRNFYSYKENFIRYLNSVRSKL